MVIITDANGNIQSPTIPENVYQGSNLANNITFLSPLPQSSECIIAFRLPNGVLTEPIRMTPYTDVPSQYELNAWVCNLDETITALYGQVSFQIKVYSSGKVVASCQGSFPVLRGVPPILPPEPTTSIYEQILEALSVINADMENGWFESKGLLPYDENFEYSIGVTLFDKATDTLYTSLQDENLGNPLSDTDWWGKTKIYNGSSQDIQDMIDASIAIHNSSATAHEDLFNAKQNSLTLTQLDAVNSGIDSAKVSQIATNTNAITTINSKIPAQASSSNQLADKNFVNSSIATNTANFIGTFENVPDLLAYSGTITNNDYAFVVNSVITDNGNDWATFAALDAYNKDLVTDFDYAWVENGAKFDLYRFDITTQTWEQRATNIDKADVTLNTQYNRYKYNDTTEEWIWEYPLNNSSFTAAQWAAINSGATAELIAKIGTSALNTTAQDLSGAVNELNSALSNKQDTIQYSTMPTASADNVGQIVQFTGTTGTYKNGFFYKCALDNGNYVWEEIVFGSTLTPLSNEDIDTIMDAILV